MMSDPEGLKIARRLIAGEAEKKTGFLNLGMLGLTELPPELNGLQHLRCLNLGLWFVDQSGEWIKTEHNRGRNQLHDWAFELPQLTDLFLTGCFLSNLAPLSGLASLQQLNCWDTQVSDLAPLSGLASLQQLDCSETPVSDLAPLSGLASLQQLYCWKTPVSDLAPLSGLASLQQLNCSGTQVSDLAPLSGLASLQHVYCSHTAVSDLAPLSRLASLQHVACSRTAVSDLAPLSRLASLQHVDCSETAVSDLAPLSRLASLQHVDCSETAVSDLAPLSRLASLRTLSASDCELVEFPRGLLESDDLELQLYFTRIPGVPQDVLSQNRWADDCRARLRDHFIDLQEGSEPVPDMKLIVIGNGVIGKTQICRRLCGEDYDESVSSTHGISVLQTPLSMGDGEHDALLNLWDFGGQDLYHGTHTLFMQTRAVFLVVWTPPAENIDEYEHGGMTFRNQLLPYWLDYVRNAAGRICPVVVVQNQCDTPQDEVLATPVDQAELEKFPYLQHVHYSAKLDRKRESLNEALREAIIHLRGHEGITTIGKGRMMVRRQIQTWIDEDAHRERDRRQHRTLAQAQFRKLCDDTGHVTSPASLLDYLHNAGIVFYKSGLFRDEIVLDQSWALDAIYTVFHRELCYRQLQQLGGRFTRSLLDSLVWQDYSPDEQQLFLSMMESCGICFIHRHGDERHNIEAEYIAPDLLPSRDDVSSQLLGRWDGEAEVMERAWSYEFLHPGSVRSIISRVGGEAGGCAVYWKCGVWFYESTTRAQAIIEQSMQDDRRGRIVLQTQHDRGGELLERISEWIEECHARAGSPRCEVEGEPIRRDRPGRRGRGREQFEPPSSDQLAVPDKRPLQITDPPRSDPKPQACVSYAWKDEGSADPDRAKKVEQFCEALTTAGHSILRDTTHLGIGNRLSSFMRQIGGSDRIYIFLSDAYLKSPNCMNELLLIWHSSCDNPERFIERTRVFTMPDTDIFSIPGRLEYAGHWKKQREDIKKLIEEHGVDVLGPAELANWKKIQDFAHNVSEMLVHVADVLQATNFDQYIDHAIHELGDDD